jgi:hypothetical protein
MEAVMLTENPEFGQQRVGALLSEDLVLLKLLPVLAHGPWGGWRMIGGTDPEAA